MSQSFTNQQIRLAQPTTGTPSTVTGTTTNSTTLLAANANRLGFTVYNSNPVGSGVILYLSLGSTCTPTNFTLPIAAGGYYEDPFQYTGIVTGVFSSASGQANIVELT